MANSPAFLPGKSHRQRSLAGYSPWGCKESETTEHTYHRMENKREMEGQTLEVISVSQKPLCPSKISANILERV